MRDNTFSDPAEVLSRFPIYRGETVVDIGSGMGKYSIPVAVSVGSEGSVYAIEVQLSHVDFLKSESEKMGLTQINVLWGDAELPEGTKLKEGIADVLILTNVLFMIEDKEGLMKELNRISKPGTRVLVVDWADSHGGIGPHPTHVVPADYAKELFESNGFIFEKDIPGGSHHYGMIFNKK
jgi:ubiquinone/menaquinone biosynthesis C-methylase UbiE